MKQHVFSQSSGRHFIPMAAIGAAGSPVTTFSGTIRTAGANFIDGAGNVLFMRGASYSGYELADINGFGNPDASGAQAGQPNGPDLTAMRDNWRLGVVRFPLNSGSWMGGTYYDVNGNTVIANSSGTYQQQVIAQVDAAIAAGFYVVLDLHWTSVGKVAPRAGQMDFADDVNGPAFWTSLANTFGYPNGTHANPGVMFELFNEPIIYDWNLLRNGGTQPYYHGQGNGLGPIYYTNIYPYPATVTSGTFTPGELFTSTAGVSGRVIYYDAGQSKIYLCDTASSTLATIANASVITGSTSGAHATITGASNCNYAGHQSLINAVRATGATNVCLVSGLNFSSDLSGWVANVVNDPKPAGYSGTWVPQIAAVWHAYPDSSGTFSGPYGSGNYGWPNYGQNAYDWCQSVLTAGYPVIITEVGGKTGAGGATANSELLCSNVDSWAGTHNVTTLFWSWDVWGNTDDVCILDAAGVNPTIGQGQVQKTWALTYSSRYGT